MANRRFIYRITNVVRVLFVVCLALAAIAPAWARPGAQELPRRPVFLSVISDVPLMPGLYEIPDNALIFDKPEGRVVEVAAQGQGLDPVVVLSFYRQTLPQFGWQAGARGTYLRERESLDIRVVINQGTCTVFYFVSPR